MANRGGICACVLRGVARCSGGGRILGTRGVSSRREGQPQPGTTIVTRLDVRSTRARAVLDLRHIAANRPRIPTRLNDTLTGSEPERLPVKMGRCSTRSTSTSWQRAFNRTWSSGAVWPTSADLLGVTSGLTGRRRSKAAEPRFWCQSLSGFVSERRERGRGRRVDRGLVRRTDDGRRPVLKLHTRVHHGRRRSRSDREISSDLPGLGIQRLTCNPSITVALTGIARPMVAPLVRCV